MRSYVGKMAGYDLCNQSFIRGKLLDHSLRHYVQTHLRPIPVLFGGHGGGGGGESHSVEVKRLEHQLTTHLHLIMKLRIHGTSPTYSLHVL
jgi:hypothetical protein